MGDQQHHRFLRRLLEGFQQGIDRIAVHLVDAVDQADAPAALGAGAFFEEMRSFARLIDGDLAAPALAFIVPGAPQHEQIGTGARLEQLTYGIGRTGSERAELRRSRSAKNAPCGAPGEACLADAARTGDQPGMMQTTTTERGREICFRRLMPEQVVALARRQTAGLGIGTEIGISAHNRRAPRCSSMTLMAWRNTVSAGSPPSITIQR